MGLGKVWRKLPLPWRRERWAGDDLVGNMYFQSPSIGPGYKEKRFVVFADAALNSEYTPNSIDVLWSSWLRHTRSRPPTIEELEADVRRVEQLRIKVDAINQKDAVAKENEKMLGESPEGVGEEYKPGAWKP